MREYNLEILTFIMFGMVTFSAVFYNGLSLVQDDVSLYVSFHPPWMGRNTFSRRICKINVKILQAQSNT